MKLDDYSHLIANNASPDLLAQPDPLNNSVLPHNAYVVSQSTFTSPLSKSSSAQIRTNTPQNDGVTPYIDWAIANDYGVIDINFPQSHISNEFNDPYTQRTNEIKLQAQAKELLIWVWENHIETTDACVAILCIGDCYGGVKALLTSRGMFSYHLTPTLSLFPISS